MKVTSIKQQVKNIDRVSVFVDGKYSFSLSLDELIKHKIKNGDELSPADIKKFKKISADGKLKMRALEWLLSRPRSEREFKDYLYRKKVESDHIERLVEEMTTKGYLDNHKFAVWFTDFQIRKSKSNRAIRAELFKKGISREVAEEVIKHQESDEAQRLNLLIEKKGKHLRYKNNPLKFAKYLTSQGFNYQLVKQALKIDHFNN